MMTAVNAVLETWLKQLAQFAPKLLASVGILVGLWLASCVLKRVIARLADARDPGKQDVFRLLGQIAQMGLWIFGIVTALGTVGINISALVAGLGLTGFALGFAFRDALSNLLAGILIFFYRPFQRGDQIAVVGFEGVVAAIDLRYTTLKNGEKTFLIPNSTLFTNPITLAGAAPVHLQPGRAPERAPSLSDSPPSASVPAFAK
jgi:small-conductance mechanosensitive channel